MALTLTLNVSKNIYNYIIYRSKSIGKIVEFDYTAVISTEIVHILIILYDYILVHLYMNYAINYTNLNLLNTL